MCLWNGRVVAAGVTLVVFVVKTRRDWREWRCQRHVVTSIRSRMTWRQSWRRWRRSLHPTRAWLQQLRADDHLVVGTFEYDSTTDFFSSPEWHVKERAYPWVWGSIFKSIVIGHDPLLYDGKGLGSHVRRLHDLLLDSASCLFIEWLVIVRHVKVIVHVVLIRGVTSIRSERSSPQNDICHGIITCKANR